MRDAAPTRSNVWLSGVLPSALALLVAALLLVERLQTDLAVADRSPRRNTARRSASNARTDGRL